MLAIEVPKEQLRDFCKKWKVTELALFGSVTRPEEFGPESDVDVLVTFEEGAGWSLFDWVTMKDDLGAIFGRQIDIAERAAIAQSRNYLRRGEILGSAVPLDVA